MRFCRIDGALSLRRAHVVDVEVNVDRHVAVVMETGSCTERFVFCVMCALGAVVLSKGKGEGEEVGARRRVKPRNGTTVA